jgi:hypothetical protein
MSDRVPIQLARSKNSRPSSPSSGVVQRHPESFAVSQTPRIFLCASLPKSPQYNAPCSFLSLSPAGSLDIPSRSPIKTHSTRTLQRFSPIHF